MPGRIKIEKNMNTKKVINNIENKYASNHQGSDNLNPDAKTATNTDRIISVRDIVLDLTKKSPVVPRLNFEKAGLTPVETPVHAQQIYEVSKRIEESTTIRTFNKDL